MTSPLAALVTALRTDGAAPLAWHVKHCRDGNTQRVWDECDDPFAMIEFIRVAPDGPSWCPLIEIEMDGRHGGGFWSEHYTRISAYRSVRITFRTTDESSVTIRCTEHHRDPFAAKAIRALVPPVRVEEVIAACGKRRAG